ncbi:TetR/AcrR family transcriptional regulator [Guptibacillus hwajinpoensis]|uniref:TetR/AcrR family transcriptional regulator n=1 Tax=Guptibacillus hwajinpoensis TaxID=208199 RepID=UPI001CFE8321|nr:TetR/AcrR family transcriptional regulator [Pseudalkalibacillus hwajinpoensis]WLR58892.1 TetR/AcrR family transcriptional regulator [Pseudalkalibacillus hwajinpoensis]
MKFTKDIVIREALDIAERENVSKVTMATIARNLSIKPPSLYNHFDGLDDIKNAMAVSALNQFFNWLSEKTENQTDGDRNHSSLSRGVHILCTSAPWFV